MTATGFPFLMTLLSKVIPSCTVAPALSASSQATAMVGPSAIGSEKGICNSMISTPPFTSASATFSDSPTEGYPAIMCAMKSGFLPLAKSCSRAFILVFEELLKALVLKRAREVEEVFVATTRERDDDHVIVRHLWRDLTHFGECVRALERRDNPFMFCEVIGCGDSLIVRGESKLHTAFFIEVGKIRADAGIVEAGWNGVRGRYLPV